MNRHYQKFTLFFVLIALCLTAVNCSFHHAKSDTKGNKNNANAQVSKNYKEPKRIATVQDDAVKESSGIVASRKNADVFWTHNDSGDGAFIYAFDRAGKKLGVWKVAGAKNDDWEGIAAYTDAQTGESYLLIGDIGDNERNRAELVIYKVIEPNITPADADSSKKSPLTTENAEKISVAYPNGKHDAETMLVNPTNGDVYIVSKNMAEEANVYKLPAPFETGGKHTLQNLGKFSVPSLTKGFLTGGDISPDGKRLIICDYFAAYEIVLPTLAKNFDDIWKQKAEQVDLGERNQGEAICYSADGKAIYATSEKRPTPLIEVQRK